MKHTTMTILAAAGLAVLAGCGKPAAEPAAYASFELQTAVRAADGAKTHWDAAAYWWDDGDMVLINGDQHKLGYNADEKKWKTTKMEGAATTAADGGKFYVVHAGGGSNSVNGSKYNSAAHTYGPVDLGAGQVPLACAGNTNRMTLYPCCAVVRVLGLTNEVVLELNDVEVPTGGTIDIAQGVITNATGTTNTPPSFVIGDDTYFIIPMESESISTSLVIYDDDGNAGETSSEVPLKVRTLYSIDPSNF